MASADSGLLRGSLVVRVGMKSPRIQSSSSRRRRAAVCLHRHHRVYLRDFRRGLSSLSSASHECLAAPRASVSSYSALLFPVCQLLPVTQPPGASSSADVLNNEAQRVALITHGACKGAYSLTDSFQMITCSQPLKNTRF